MSKPITRRTSRPITRRVPNPEEIRRAATIDRVMKAASTPPGGTPVPAPGVLALEKRIAAMEEKLDALLARPPAQPASVDEVMEQALEARLNSIAQTIEDAAAQRAIAALDPRIDEVVAAKTKGARPTSALDPRTIVELVDQRVDHRLKEALEHRFRAMLAHLEGDVIPRVLKKYASGI